ncbi:uncharacterized protein LOC107032720 isoform X1 [Solanum pennellii]|uniref:Uncharacterized protein LOC107032720 isoform X1 n=1 Tax=Solanum pennellii TaxID=28526 RepID=A0ABM1UX30_SOLPN|nr:uncharacterized protein LOC107032720 isoform X1 [Solanum pennellii]XP_027768048.1 uncharacterized protein LOC107032720 isoform X1 [Solanum pennellii]
MVTIPDPFLKVWWRFMNNDDKMIVQKRIGYLQSLLEMNAWPGLIGTMVKFWDSENMVFWFGEVELTPTIQKVLISYESVAMCNKRKRHPNTDLLYPIIWDFAKIREKFSLVKAEWMNKLPGPNIPFRELHYRFGCERAYEKYKYEFLSKEKWNEMCPLTFAICLLGTIVFPQGPKYTIHPSVFMVSHSIFYEVDYKTLTKYYTLGPMILADIYRALDKFQSGECFFQVCNLIQHLWMMRHLIKTHNPKEPDPLRWSDELHGHDWWLYHNRCNKIGGEIFVYSKLRGLRDENV